MKAMILAAGRGERMRPLTDHTPKPLLEVGGKALIVRVIERLVEQGFDELVLNTAWLGDVLEQRLGDGRDLGADIHYSREHDGALGTAGGVLNALPLLGKEPFLVVNGDVYTDYPFSRLRGKPQKLAHVVLIDNPDHWPGGDFGLVGERVLNTHSTMLTFSGISALHPALFDHLRPGKAELAPVLREAIERDQVTGEHYRGHWTDVGTPERLDAIDAELRGAGRS